MAWWDDLGDALGQFVDDWKKDYEELDKNLGGWLPLGYDNPQTTQSQQGEEQFPGQYGLQNAWEQSQSETQPWKSQIQYDTGQDIGTNVGNNLESVMSGHLTAPIRDVPVLGGATRAAEFGLNSLNELSNRAWTPFIGTARYYSPEEIAYRNEQASKEGRPLESNLESDPFGLTRLQKGWEAVTGTPAQQEAGRQKFEQLGTLSKLAAIAGDPTNLIALPTGAKPTAIKRAAQAAAATKPITEMTRLERLAAGVSDAAYEAAKAGTIAEVPLEAMRAEHPLAKVPVVGKLAELTGKSKVEQDIATLSDQATGRLGEIIKTASSDDQKITDVAKAVQDMVLPTEDALARMGKSAESSESVITRKLLSGFNPETVVKKYEQGKVAYQELADLKASGTATQAALQKAVEATKNLPKNADEAVAMLGRDMVEHAATIAKKAYGVSDKKGLVDNFVRIQKNILSTALLAANPNYPVGNAVSNFALTVLSGYNPFRTSGKSERVMREAGLLTGGLKKGEAVAFSPARATAAIGQADVEINKLSKFTGVGLAQWLEKVQGEGLWTQAFEKYLRQGLGKLIPQDVLSPNVRAALNNIDPKLAGWVEDIIKNGASTPEEAIKKINQMPGFQKGKTLPELINLIPDEFKNDPEMLAVMKRAGLDDLEAKIKACKSFEEVQAVIDDAKKVVQDQLAKIDAAARGTAEQTAKGETQTGNIAQSVLDFIKKDREARNQTFAAGVDIRSQGAETAADALAKEWDTQREVRKDLLTTLTARLKGVIPDKGLESVNKAFAEWDTKAEALQQAKNALRKKYGSDVNSLRIESAALDAKYTAEMKKVRTKANSELYGLLKQKEAFDLSGLPVEKKAEWNAYWKRVFSPEVPEEALQAQYAKDMSKLADDAARQARSDEYHAARQKLWADENAWQQKAEQDLFGGVASQETGATATQTAARGVTSLASDPYVVAERLKWQSFDRMLDGMLQNAKTAFDTPITGKIDEATQKAIVNAVYAQKAAYTDAKLAAMKMANADRDFALLNYSHKYNFDNYLATVLPFGFWQNSMVKNATVKMLEEPGRFFAYSRYKQLLNEAEDEPGFPQRLRGLLRVSLPGAPDWMGDQFIDPLGRALMFNQLTYPLQAAQWSNEDQSSLAQLLGSPSPLLTIPYNLATGNAKEVSTLLPLTRNIKAATALYKEASNGRNLPFADQIPAGGVNIESGIRTQLAKSFPGLPQVDQYDDYRIRRMLENMVQDGTITPQQMEDAAVSKSGSVYDMAVQRVGVESGIGQLPIVSGAMNLKTFPSGEEKRIAENADLNKLAITEASKATGSPVTDITQAWNILKEKKLTGKGSAISRWYDDHPEYGVRGIVTAEESQVPNVVQTSQTWRELDEGGIPTKWKNANLTQEERDALQAFYDAGNVTNMTNDQKTQLKSAIDKINTGRDTDEFKTIAALGKEIQALIESEFNRLGGPAGVDNKYDWIKQANGGKTTSAIAKWYADHPEYSNYGNTTASGTSTGTSTKTSTYQPKTYTPYTKTTYNNPGGVWSNAWTQFKRYAPTLVKAMSTYIKGGKADAIFLQQLWEAYKRMGITIKFEDWIRRLISDSGLATKTT